MGCGLWAVGCGLWAVVWAELWNKRVWANYEQLLRAGFSCFWGQKIILIFFENTTYSDRTEKLHNTLFYKKFFLIFFDPENTKNTHLFGGADNLSVNTWRSWPDICSLICATCRQLAVMQFHAGEKLLWNNLCLINNLSFPFDIFLHTSLAVKK